MDSKYRRMLKLMQLKEEARGKNNVADVQADEKPWFLYILECNDNSFYTGITNDLQRRFKQHLSGKASHYTRTRRPVKLIYHELCASRTQALVRECAVKSLPRNKKEELVSACYSINQRLEA